MVFRTDENRYCFALIDLGANLGFELPKISRLNKVKNGDQVEVVGYGDEIIKKIGLGQVELLKGKGVENYKIDVNRSPNKIKLEEGDSGGAMLFGEYLIGVNCMGANNHSFAVSLSSDENVAFIENLESILGISIFVD